MLTRLNRQVDNAVVELRGDVAVFTGEPLGADLDVVGPVRAHVQLRTEPPYADLFVRLCDVDERQTSRNVVDGIRRLDPTIAQGAGLVRGADGVVVVDLDLTPTAYRFHMGHLLRVQVAGGTFPRYARNLGTGAAFSAMASAHRSRSEPVHPP
jgi:putative CocE/NonD family hydrolase